MTGSAGCALCEWQVEARILGGNTSARWRGASGASSFGCPTDYSCCNQVTAFTNIHRMWRLKLPHNVDNKLSTRPSVASVACSLHCWTDDRTARSHTAKVTAPMCRSFALLGAGHYHHHHDLWRLAAAAAQGPMPCNWGWGESIMSSHHLTGDFLNWQTNSLTFRSDQLPSSGTSVYEKLGPSWGPA